MRQLWGKISKDEQRQLQESLVVLENGYIKDNEKLEALHLCLLWHTNTLESKDILEDLSKTSMDNILGLSDERFSQIKTQVKLLSDNFRELAGVVEDLREKGLTAHYYTADLIEICQKYHNEITRLTKAYDSAIDNKIANKKAELDRKEAALKAK